MIDFLIKGILRDKNRSLLPVIIVSIGVFLTVLLTAWLKGVFTDMIELNANFSTGHVKIMTRAYAENANQAPNDLALLGTGELISDLEETYPGLDWVQRIRFGGLLDVPDSSGDTRAQGPVIGQGIDLFSPGSRELARMNIRKSLVSGSVPDQSGEALISHDFADRFRVAIGDEVTLFSSTMYGSMAFTNFIVAGTVRFGTAALDRGAIIIDITDAQVSLDMQDAAGEILGYFQSGVYYDEKATAVKETFNAAYADNTDEFAPEMVQLKDQSGLDEYLAYADSMSGIMITILVFALSVVLWNTGLLGGLRRYTEFGIRLALGEEKKHIYKTLLYEAVIIGFIGSVLGTLIGLAASFFLQEHGIDFGQAIPGGGAMMMPTVYRAMITPEAYYIGFIPGVFSMTLGNALSGLGVYKRETARLFKELEV